MTQTPASAPEYLRNEQYADGTNLRARQDLHARFSTNPQGWQRWVFEQLSLPSEARILELGCGPGALWRENAERIPPGWQVTLSDFSPGMLAEARASLAALPRPFRFQVVDAQAIPLADATLDGVIANHMLYHVPDIDRALAEIHRVLRPGGRLYAATNGARHMRELEALMRRMAPDLPAIPVASAPFSLENGGEQLAAHFAHVELRRYEDALLVTEAEPLVDYVASIVATWRRLGEKRAEFARLVEQEIAAHGAIRIGKETGLFVAC